MSGSYAAAHGAHRGLNLLLPGRVGLKHVLDERLADGQQLRELALDLHPAATKARITDRHSAEASWERDSVQALQTNYPSQRFALH